MDSRLRTPTLIYEFFAEIGRPKGKEEALVRSIYPKEYVMSDEIRKQIPKFVWPMRTENDKEEHFTFVLTDLDSKYKFGFCRYPPKGEFCMVFLSDLPWYKVFYRALDKVSDLLLDHQIEVVEPFLKGLHAHPLPNLGVDTILSVVPSEVDSGQVYSFPLPHPKKLAEIPTDDNLTQFYTNLHYNVILHLFANMIFERRIIITSKSLSLLSSTVHGAVLLLYPLHWQHIFIPITPPHLLDYCGAPMPFLMGVHSSYMDIVRRTPTDDIVILDVDESTIESSHVEDLLTLPPDVVSTLKHVLKKQSSAYGDTVTRSFMLAQVAMIGGYRSALKLRPGEKEVIFDEEQFLKSRPNMEEFLGQLLHFQHFQQFINSKIDKLKHRNLERDIFDNEVLAYEEELKGAEQVKAVFDKFISSTVESSKKFAEFSGKLGGNIKKQVKQARIVMKKKNLKHKSQHSNRYEDQQLNFTNPSLTPSSRTNSLPATYRSAGVNSSHGTFTPPPNLGNIRIGQAKSRPPPPVIPYHRHLEGKKKLAESLKQQAPSGILHSFTPPDTPSNLNPDESSLDCGERISLNSNTEIVVVNDLIDISSDPGPSAENSQDIVLDSSSSHSISTASSSDEIDSDVHNSPPPPPIDQRHNWEKFDEDDPPAPISSSSRPPLPPPRSELEKLYNTVPSKPQVSEPPVKFTIDGPSDGSVSTNPFAASESTSRPKSPFEDFSSSIAEVLMSNSEDRFSDDPTSASTLATTGRELFEITEEQPTDEHTLESFDLHVSSSTAPVLQPTVTSSGNAPMFHSASSPGNLFPGATTSVFNPVSAGMPTSDISTAQVRTHINPIAQHPRHQPIMNRHLNLSSSVLRPIPQEGTFSADSIANHTNPFYSGSVNAGNYPALIPLPQKPSGPRSPSYVQNFPLPGNKKTGSHSPGQRRSGKPPLKPQPYSGDCPWNQQTNGNNSNSTDAMVLQRRQSSAPFQPQRLPSIGDFDPFGDLLNNGSGGMAGYVLQNSNVLQ